MKRTLTTLLVAMCMAILISMPAYAAANATQGEPQKVPEGYVRDTLSSQSSSSATSEKKFSLQTLQKATAAFEEDCSNQKIYDSRLIAISNQLVRLNKEIDSGKKPASEKEIKAALFELKRIFSGVSSFYIELGDTAYLKPGSAVKTTKADLAKTVALVSKLKVYLDTSMTKYGGIKGYVPKYADTPEFKILYPHYKKYIKECLQLNPLYKEVRTWPGFEHYHSNTTTNSYRYIIDSNKQAEYIRRVLQDAAWAAASDLAKDMTVPINCKIYAGSIANSSQGGSPYSGMPQGKIETFVYFGWAPAK